MPSIIRTTWDLLENVDISMFSLIHALELEDTISSENEDLIVQLKDMLAKRLAGNINKKSHLARNTGGIKYFPNGVCTAYTKRRLSTDNATIILPEYKEEKVEVKKDIDRILIKRVECLGSDSASIIALHCNKTYNPASTRIFNAAKGLTVNELIAWQHKVKEVVHSLNKEMAGKRVYEIERKIKTERDKYLKAEAIFLSNLNKVTKNSGSTSDLVRNLLDSKLQIYRQKQSRDYEHRDQNIKSSILKMSPVDRKTLLDIFSILETDDTILEKMDTDICSAFDRLTIALTDPSSESLFVSQMKYQKRLPITYSVPIWTDEAAKSFYDQCKAYTSTIVNEELYTMTDNRSTFSSIMTSVKDTLPVEQIIVHFENEAATLQEIFMQDTNIEPIDRMITPESLLKIEEVYTRNKFMLKQAIINTDMKFN